MSSLGGLYAMMVGNRGLQQMKADQRYEQEMQFKKDLTKRQHPTIGEESEQIQALKGQSPSALEDLLRFSGKKTEGDQEVLNKLYGAQADYYGAQAESGKNDPYLTGLNLQAEIGLKNANAQKALKEASQSGIDKPLSAEASKALTLATGGVSKIRELRKRIEGGASLIMPGVFDRGTDAIIADLADRIAKMRTGAGMNKGEESLYRGQVSDMFDPKQVKLKKLKDLEDEFYQYGKGIVGDKRFEQGLNVRNDPSPMNANTSGGGLLNTMVETLSSKSNKGAPQLDPRDMQALQQAKANPNAPGAQAVIRHFQSMGVQ